MKLGVISDTHDRIPYIEKAIEIFNQEDLAAVLHCGDFVSPFAILPFKKLNSPFYAVFGNNDGEKHGLTKLFKDNGWTLNQRPWTFSLDGKKITMLHEPARLEDQLAGNSPDLLVFGHTHEKYMEMRGNALVVNPGEGCGWVKGLGSVSVVDLGRKECVFIDL